MRKVCEGSSAVYINETFLGKGPFSIFQQINVSMPEKPNGETFGNPAQIHGLFALGIFCIRLP